MTRRVGFVSRWSGLCATTFVILLLLPACGSRKQAPVDRSILTDNPCAAPCWQWIIPGKTTSAEAWDTLSELEFLNHNYYPYKGKGGEAGVEWIAWRTTAGGDSARLGNYLAYDGIVTQLEIPLDFELTLQEVLDKYGVPEKLLAYQIGSDILNTNIHFYYPQRGLIFVSWADSVPPSEPFVLVPTTPLTVVYYFEPTSMPHLFDDLPQYARRLRFGEEYLLDWQGLGPIDVLD